MCDSRRRVAAENAMSNPIPSSRPRATVSIGAWEFKIYDGDAPAPPATIEERFEGESPLMQVRAVHATRGLALVVTVPADSFHTGEPHLDLLFVPETETLFIAGGETAVAYHLSPPRHVMYTDAECGFWTWHRAGDVIVMEAELSLVAFDLRGKTLWSAWFEPPHSMWVEGDKLRLEAYRCNHIEQYEGLVDAREGPPARPA